MFGVVFTGLEAVFTEVKVITVPAFESRPIYWEHLTAITPVGGMGLHCVTFGDIVTKKWKSLKHIHTSLQGEHWAPVPSQTTNQSSGTAEESLLSHPFHWH